MPLGLRPRRGSDLRGHRLGVRQDPGHEPVLILATPSCLLELIHPLPHCTVLLPHGLVALGNAQQEAVDLVGVVAAYDAREGSRLHLERRRA